MIPYKFLATNILETLLRVLPLPVRTGIIKLGNPGRTSPVFLTCNYHLTVERVKRSLGRTNAYLLIANSKGINVWCAATGGLLTNHDVISALKTSGIENLVDHRKIILPQLAGTGVQGNTIHRKTGWNVVWGPVYAKDIPAFVQNKYKKTVRMREVEFPWTHRIEMAVAWAFPSSFVLALVIAPFQRETILPLVFLIWGLSFLIFLSFPLYSRWLDAGGATSGFILFDFGKGAFRLILLGTLILGLILYSFLSGRLDPSLVCKWALFITIAVFLLSIDLMGSTPVTKSRLHKDRLFQVILDKNRCRGAGFCGQICPRNCYRVDAKNHTTEMLGSDRCVQCGACIVQCPFDALYFRNPGGETIQPETIRRFKLNLLGKRMTGIGKH